MQPAEVEVVAVRKIKRPVASGTWWAFAVAEDVHGRWLYTPPGSSYLGWYGDRTTEWQVGREDRDNCPPVLQLLPHTGWWTAATGTSPDSVVLRCPLICVDVCTPPIRVNDEWTYDDLDLDPILHGTGLSGWTTRSISMRPAGQV